MSIVAQQPLRTTHISKLIVFTVIVFISFFFISYYSDNKIEKNVDINYTKRRSSKRFLPRQRCYCKGHESHPKIETVRSTCSPEASQAGLYQNVVSYSYFIFEEDDRDYKGGIQANLENIREFYPNWLMRVYSDMPLTTELCNLVCENDDFYFCPVKYADTLGIGKISQEFPMQWRFLVLGDDTVQKFLIRDLDSRISAREVDAVKEWEKSSKMFHAMRDNPYHNATIMGGMWGGNNMLLDIDKKSLQKKIVVNRQDKDVGIDQSALEVHIYPFREQNQIMIHDSYLCDQYNDSVPFPTQRKKPDEFVGRAVIFDSELPICPEKCRPSYGQDWMYC